MIVLEIFYSKLPLYCFIWSQSYFSDIVRFVQYKYCVVKKHVANVSFFAEIAHTVVYSVYFFIWSVTIIDALLLNYLHLAV